MGPIAVSSLPPNSLVSSCESQQRSDPLSSLWPVCHRKKQVTINGRVFERLKEGREMGWGARDPPPGPWGLKRPTNEAPNAIPRQEWIMFHHVFQGAGMNQDVVHPFLAHVQGSSHKGEKKFKHYFGFISTLSALKCGEHLSLQDECSCHDMSLVHCIYPVPFCL